MKLTIFKIFTIIAISGILLVTALPLKAAGLKTSITDTLKTQSYPEKSTDISPLLIGEKIPVISLPAANGQIFGLNAAVAQNQPL